MKHVLGLALVGLAVVLVGCGQANQNHNDRNSVAIYDQAKKGRQIWYEVPGHGRISGDKAINAIYVLDKNKLTEYGIGDTKKLTALKGHSDSEIMKLARKWNIEYMESEYDSLYGDPNSAAYVKPKYGKSEMVKRSLPKPIKVSYQLIKPTKNADVSKEVMVFESQSFKNSTVRYGLVKSSKVGAAAGQRFIGYKTVEEVTGATNKLKNRLIQRVSDNSLKTAYDSVDESGIKVKIAN